METEERKKQKQHFILLKEKQLTPLTNLFFKDNN